MNAWLLITIGRTLILAAISGATYTLWSSYPYGLVNAANGTGTALLGILAVYRVGAIIMAGVMVAAMGWVLVDAGRGRVIYRRRNKARSS